ncbi:MAG: hypothetical protein U0166_18710 [Acidobacteriota bacterium]
MLRVSGLRKRYGNAVILDGPDLDVERWIDAARPPAEEPSPSR